MTSFCSDSPYIPRRVFVVALKRAVAKKRARQSLPRVAATDSVVVDKQLSLHEISRSAKSYRRRQPACFTSFQKHEIENCDQLA